MDIDEFNRWKASRSSALPNPTDFDAWVAATVMARAEIAELRDALKLAMWAMRSPLDDWKGECERKALDAAHVALEPKVNLT